MLLENEMMKHLNLDYQNAINGSIDKTVMYKVSKFK